MNNENFEVKKLDLKQKKNLYFVFYFSIKLRQQIPKMVQILHLQFIYMVSYSHWLVLIFLVVNINQKSNYRKTKTLHVNYPINAASYKEIYIDEILCMINDNDRCDRMNGVLYVSLTDKRLYNQIKPSCQTNQTFLHMCTWMTGCGTALYSSNRWNHSCIYDQMPIKIEIFLLFFLRSQKVW
jgi:hypothetical protein